MDSEKSFSGSRNKIVIINVCNTKIGEIFWENIRNDQYFFCKFSTILPAAEPAPAPLPPSALLPLWLSQAQRPRPPFSFPEAQPAALREGQLAPLAGRPGGWPGAGGGGGLAWRGQRPWPRASARLSGRRPGALAPRQLSRERRWGAGARGAQGARARASKLAGELARPALRPGGSPAAAAALPGRGLFGLRLFRPRASLELTKTWPKAGVGGSAAKRSPGGSSALLGAKLGAAGSLAACPALARAVFGRLPGTEPASELPRAFRGGARGARGWRPASAGAAQSAASAGARCIGGAENSHKLCLFDMRLNLLRIKF